MLRKTHAWDRHCTQFKKSGKKSSFGLLMQPILEKDMIWISKKAKKDYHALNMSDIMVITILKKYTHRTFRRVQSKSLFSWKKKHSSSEIIV